MFENVVLAEYRCHDDWRDHTGQDIREGVFYPTRVASRQGRLIPLTPQDSLVIYRARAKRRAPSSRSPTPQLLLFEIVASGYGRLHSARV